MFSTRGGRNLGEGAATAANDTTVGNDENAENKFLGTRDLKGLAALAGNSKRSILGDKSNISATSNLTVEASRNLRSTTLRSKIPSRSNVSIVERSTAATATATATGPIANKENIMPIDTNIMVPVITTTTTANMNAQNATIPCDWDDLDSEDLEDPLMVAEYVNEIFTYMRQLEIQITPSMTYMETQKELNWHSRSVLIDWLIEVQWKLKLLPETLFLSINIIDRFLSKRSVSLVKLQLVGMAATLLASKYEEVLSPSISNFVYLSDNAYDEQELLKAERYMLHVLNFSLAYPSPLVFLRRISKAEDYDVRSRTLAKYLMEVCLIDHNFVSCPPSMMAAVSIYLAREMLKSGPWTPNLKHYSGDYSEADIKPWIDQLLAFLKKPITYEAVFKKYALKKMMKASLFVQEYMKRMFNIPAHTIRDDGKSVFTA